MAGTSSTVATRSFVAGRACFVVRCASASIRETVESLFVDLAQGTGASAPNEIVLNGHADGTISLSITDGFDMVAQPRTELLAGLTTMVNRLALDADPDRLHLHCAALSHHGRGFLFSASSGTGKTTLAAALVIRGWSYVSDEAVAFALGDTYVDGFPKPLSIKPGGADLLPGVADAHVSLGDAEDRWLHVPASALSAHLIDRFQPEVVVLLHRTPSGSPADNAALLPLHPADAVVELMGQTMDAGRFGPYAVDVLARLAAASQCVALQVGPLDQMIDLLGEISDIHGEPLPVRVLDPHNEATSGWKVSDSTRSIMIGDRVVVHDTSGGAIVALDEAGTGVWLGVHGEAPSWWQPDTFTQVGVLSFLEQLASLGLVNQPHSQARNLS